MRYVEWRINVYEHDYQVVREENGKVEIIGGAPVLSHAVSIAEGDRHRVLYDPLAVEVRPLEIIHRLA